ncbi:MAG: hypothetical protein ACFCAD_05300 [Pleurocapsa sp.]
MVSRFNWFIGTLFLAAAFGALMNPPPYIAIAILFFSIGLVLLPPTDRLTKKYFNCQIKGGIKGTIILTSLVIICLIVPQVDTNPARFSIRPSEHWDSI